MCCVVLAPTVSSTSSVQKSPGTWTLKTGKKNKKKCKTNEAVLLQNLPDNVRLMHMPLPQLALDHQCPCPPWKSEAFGNLASKNRLTPEWTVNFYQHGHKGKVLHCRTTTQESDKSDGFQTWRWLHPALSCPCLAEGAWAPLPSRVSWKLDDMSWFSFPENMQSNS